MNARHFNVLQNAAHVNGLSIAQAVQVKLNGIFQEAVKIHRVIRGNLRCLCHVGAQLIGIVDNAHAASAQHETGAHQKREAQALRHFAGLFERACHASCGVRYFQLIQNVAEQIAVFGQVNGGRTGANNGHAGVFQRLCKLERRLSAQRDNHAIGVFGFHNVHYIFVRKRLEIQLVGSVVIGGHGLGVTVDHDGLKAFRRKRVGGMHAAVIEFDALANAVGTRA